MAKTMKKTRFRFRPPTDEMPLIGAHCSEELRAKVEARATELCIPKSEIVRRALEAYLA